MSTLPIPPAIAHPRPIGSSPAAPPARARPPIAYPAEDGRLLAETQAHLDQIIYLVVALQQFFAAIPDVFVAGDLLLYHVEGDVRQRVAPDVFVARGVRDAKALRRTYLLWEEGSPPEVVIEVTSAGSRHEDTREKRDLYARLGVGEYFLFDPLAEYLRPPLQGYRLVSGRYEPLAPLPDGGLRSVALGLDLRLRSQWLRLYDPERDEWLLSPDEQAAARQEAEQRAAAAEAEVARLRALLEQRDEPG